MINIRFPDGSVRQFARGLTGSNIAHGISPSLEKRTVAMLIDGTLTDLATEINTDCSIEFIDRKHPKALPLLRHSAAHVLGEAVQALWPDAKLATGPATENGFFYDVFRDPPISVSELPQIEDKMREIVKANKAFRRMNVLRSDMNRLYEERAEPYKLEIIEGISDEVVSLYKQGSEDNSWFDMCRGPHVASTSHVGDAFKLDRVSGVYWRGRTDEPMLSRISGSLFATKEELADFEFKQAEAIRRDHRKTGPALDYFHFDEKAPGSVFWHPKGWQVFQRLIEYIRRVQAEAGYQEINTPDMMDKSLWEISGHWQNYHANMFTTTTEDGREFAFKPMNCPGHMMIYNQGIKSYRDLPVRYAEFGKVHRYEPSGALHGLMRVRSFTQDDAHIFCTPEQLLDECVAVNNLILKIYKDFGFKDVRIKLSTKPENHIGSAEDWERATTALKDALDHLGQPYTIFEGEGAFYGPKLEYVLTDAIGRDWQCGTLQVDFHLPGKDRCDSVYVDKMGTRQHPVMLHRAMFGSLERFFGILLEHFEGDLPVWLQPTQAVLIPISAEQADYVEKEAAMLRRDWGFRVVADTTGEHLNTKISNAFSSKVPYVLVYGKRELEKGRVNMRKRGEERGEEWDVRDAYGWLMTLNESKT